MKRFLFIFFVGLSLFTATTLSVLSIQTAYAQEQIELNFGDVAKDKNLIGTENYDPNNGEKGFGLLIGQVLYIVFTIAAIIILIMLLWGGIEWITSGGDKSKVEKARNRITQSIIGAFVLASVIAIFIMLQSLLGFEVFVFSRSARSNATTTQPERPSVPNAPSVPTRPGGFQIP